MYVDIYARISNKVLLGTNKYLLVFIRLLPHSAPKPAFLS